MMFPHHLIRRRRPRAGARRRGSVLVLALGVLAILSVAALSYVTIVRLDRANVVASSQRTAYESQASVVTEHIRDLLSADLFGNKIVSPNVPQFDAGVLNWPTVFEDGDARDVPTLDVSTFDDQDPGQTPAGVAVLAPGQRGYFDDAFLASTEPAWDEINPDNTTTWPQITNLNSAYTYDNANNRWVRGRGRFVDLGDWFRTPTPDLFADPSINLTNWARTNPTMIGPDRAIDQPVFQFQINDLVDNLGLGSDATLGSVRPSDERQWVDTDGDLRPDARWTTLDRLGSLYGLKWVVAARIVDASSFINVNSSIEFGGIGSYNALNLGDGRTPADIDLAGMLDRLAQEATSASAYASNVRSDRLFGNPVSFFDHLTRGLGMASVIDDLQLGPNPPTVPTLTSWTINSPTTPLQRSFFWNYFGQNPQQPHPIGRRATGYAVRELQDLASFASTNNTSLVSKLEQFIDGSETTGYLPNDMTNDLGPLRSKELATQSRVLTPLNGNPFTDAKPSSESIMLSTRRMLTPVSGVGKYSPVPFLNPNLTPLTGSQPRERVRVDQLLDTRATRLTFESLVWALAPMLTDQPLMRVFADEGSGFGYANTATEAHYGGWVMEGASAMAPYLSPARHLYQPTPALAALNISEPAASFPIITAASMAANLADAIDTPASGVGNFERPTTIALFNRPDAPATPPAGITNTAITVSTRLAQGDIPATSLPWISTNLNEPYIVVGVDRQPFLREASFFAVYSDASSDVVGNDDGISGHSQPAEALGSGIAIVLTNPWPAEINITSNYQVVIPEAANNDPAIGSYIDDLMSAPQEFRIELPASVIGPGQSVTYVWMYDNGAAVGDPWFDIREHIRTNESEFTPSASVIEVPSAAVFSSSTGPVPFDYVLGGQPRGVLLVFAEGPNEPLVLDRMRPRAGAGVEQFFPQFGDPANIGAPADFNFVSDRPDNFAAGFVGVSDWWVNELGYLPADIAVDPRYLTNQITGRVMFSANLSRPVVARAGSMSSVVIEDRERNVVTTRTDAVAFFRTTDVTDTLTATRLRAEAQLIADLSWSAGNGLDFPANTLRGSAAALTFADDANPYGGMLEELPEFALFVPNRGLITRAEMLRIGIYAHTCKDAQYNDLRFWRTASEKLGASLDMDYGRSDLGDIPNQYFGVLDPTRYILNSDIQGISGTLGIPDFMKIPLALRVPDCFEALPMRTNLAQGVININNAPRDVLEALPLMRIDYVMNPAAGDPGTGAGPVISAADRSSSLTDRSDLIIDFRNPTSNPSNGIGPIPATNLPIGFREGRSNPSIGIMTDRMNAGFATPAELAVFGSWTLSGGICTGQPTASQTGTFLELGADSGGTSNGRNDFSPLQPQEAVVDAARYGSDSTSQAADPSETVNPINDPEERMAFYSAISNITSARSDVYLAWFVLRGYDPQTIERISLPNSNPSQDQINDAIDNPDNKFQPTYESRWLVVFDRSQTESGEPIRSPLDRPRVLMQIELPPARP